MGRPRGPVPKRSEDRVRRAADLHTDRVPAGADEPVEAPPLREGLHPLAVEWYESLARSGQSRFYEPSDWAAAMVLAEAIDQYGRRPQSTMLANILTGFQTLLVTEGDRRRMRLELIRAGTAANSGRHASVRRLRAVDGLAGG